MVRKQLYLREDQDQALRQRAADTGLSEAEVVRRALDAEFDRSRAPVDKHVAAFVRSARGLSRHHHLPRSYRFSREELYERGP